MANKHDFTNERFGRLVVLREAGKDKSGNPMWECLCDCGNRKTVRIGHLQSGAVRSCGCLQKEKIADFNKANKVKHGGRNTRLYRIWSGIKTRCYNEASQLYKNYGGRGITVCPEWKDSFEIFREWAISNGYDENAPRGQCTIDRIDVNGNYEPSNCRWANMKRQSNNKRTNYYVTHNGEAHTITEWAEITGIKRMTLYSRLAHGWPVEKALTKPVRK